MFRRVLAPLLLSTTISVLAACGEGQTQPPPQLPTPAPAGLQTPPPGAIYLGVYVSPLDGGITTLESKIARKFAIDAHYYGWVGEFPHLTENADVANGRYAVDSWDCGVSDAQIASGAEDQLIVTRAQLIKSYGHPLFLRFFWDPNLPSSTPMTYSNQSRNSQQQPCYDPKTDNSDGTFSATEYVAAYTHIRQIFSQQGVNNVIWVWSVAEDGGVDPTPYYPGDSQVDWIGVDVYDSGGTSFQTIFSPIYPSLASHNKPILVAEAASTRLFQETFLNGLPAALQSSFPAVKGFMYFDFSKMWELSGAGLTDAFFTVSNDPYMNAYGTP